MLIYIIRLLLVNEFSPCYGYSKYCFRIFL